MGKMMTQINYSSLSHYDEVMTRLAFKTEELVLTTSAANHLHCTTFSRECCSQYILINSLSSSSAGATLDDCELKWSSRVRSSAQKSFGGKAVKLLPLASTSL